MDTKFSPDFLFETSWEVCNKVGGIHTVIATKALTATKLLHDRYIAIGPDVNREFNNPEFEEDPSLLKDWKESLLQEGIRIKIGRWKIEGSPLVILVGFSQLIQSKDEIFKGLWETYRVDSISGQWDYIEPVLFGYAAGKVIEHYVASFCQTSDKVVAHFHEWMTSSGGLYLQKYSPYIATVFTTHATVMGRSIAGNGLPLYGNLTRLNADKLAQEFGVLAKHSLEKTAAANYDCFATVSDLTARECKYLLGKEVSIVTPNGFENNFVWDKPTLDKKRKDAKAQMIGIAEMCLGIKYTEEPMIVGTSGRYEFKNKGLDVFIDALLKLSEDKTLKCPILAYITVPAGNLGPRKDIQAKLADPSVPVDHTVVKHITHYLSEPAWDPILHKIRNTRLEDPDNRVQLIFVPCYLNGDDGIFDKHYYELLCGMDITVYPSYYEPWGYTPLESIAFSVPTVTTSLTGFGLWVADSLMEHKGVEVIKRNDNNDSEVSSAICKVLSGCAATNTRSYNMLANSALEISKIALWDHLFDFYLQAYNIALSNMVDRSNRIIYEGGGSSHEQVNFVKQQLTSSRPVWTQIMVERTIPQRLHPLDVLSKNLWWSWSTGAYEIWEYIDNALWRKCEKNPIELLDRLSYKRLKELEQDSVFLEKMDSVYNTFQCYMAEKEQAKGPKIAYFSMEYGLHSSLKIYSGGLGILAGDYLKEASDKNVPMVAIGLLYRYGYFTQRLSSAGDQEARYEPQNFLKLPIVPVRDDSGNWVSINLALPGRNVTGRIWRCDVGRTELYLIDTDHDLNSAEDRSITYHLYGGDWENRLKQEIILGIGGIRALNEMKIKQDVFHCNEGHAAFIGIERIRDLIDSKKLSFSEALEVVRSSSLFTTHTPVPAGHDAFPESMIRQYMAHYPDRLKITWEQFISLGKMNPNDPNEKVSMSSLACNLSQEVNGVSWLHGEVSKEILGNMWPGYFKDELHVGYVTNGVHFPTWVASKLKELYTAHFPDGFMNKEYSIPQWQKVHDIDDMALWNTRLMLKNKLMARIKKMVGDLKQFPYESPYEMIRMEETLKPEVLTIGFARRFATYKRANLLFTNLERLDRIVNNPHRPVQFLFAGKAHPNDKPGQDIIKRILEISRLPQFMGKIVFLQNYDMELARVLVQGVDVWLNTPTRPQEASGTSGEKCVMNGVLQFSVLDGWWVEGYKEGGGWSLPMENTFDDPVFQDQLDAEMIYAVIEDQIAPKYYARDNRGIPHEWMKAVKICIADIASNFTMNRMLNDYQERYYEPLYQRNKKMMASDYTMAREIAAWKRKVSAAWDNVKVLSVNRLNMVNSPLTVEDTYTIDVTLDIANLKAEDIGVEIIIADQILGGNNVKVLSKSALKLVKQEDSKAYYSISLLPEMTGSYDMSIRIFPQNSKLPHRMDFALVKWA